MKDSMEQIRPIWQKWWMLFTRGLITSDELCESLINHPFGCPALDEQPNPDEFPTELKENLQSYIASHLPWTITEFNAFSVKQEEEYQNAARRWFERLVKSFQIDVSWNEERKHFERRPSGHSQSQT